LILLVLVALAARVDAASSEASIALAVHYADVLTGVDDPEDSAATAADHEADGAGADADQADADQAAEAGADDLALAGAGDTDATDATDADATDTAAPELGDPDASAPEVGAPEAHLSLAYDTEQAAAGATLGDDAILGASPAGAIETYEASMRHLRPSRWGRLDLGLSWRRHWSEPMHARPYRLDEVWLVATWRR
jgi:hypothetical protein